MMMIPPPGSSNEDEVLSLLGRIERFLEWVQNYLARIIEGIFVFFFKRLPRWTFDFIRHCFEHIWIYIGRLIRVVIRLVIVIVLAVILGLIVIGPGVALYHYTEAHPLAMLTWSVLIVIALLFAFQRRLWKLYMDSRERLRARQSQRLVCGHCNTLHSGSTPPFFCSYCNQKWTDAEV